MNRRVLPCIGQHILAKLVMSHLQRLPNARVLFNHRVAALSQDSSGVTLTVETPQGREDMRSGWPATPRTRAIPAPAWVLRPA
jgi:2-polyprenyl-6-methoxyphenol hydroxylase-like FAD-dependent oxidoreductase